MRWSIPSNVQTSSSTADPNSGPLSWRIIMGTVSVRSMAVPTACIASSFCRVLQGTSMGTRSVRTDVAVPLLTLRERPLEVHVDVKPTALVGILGCRTLKLRHWLASDLPALLAGAAPKLCILGERWPISHSPQGSLGPSRITVSANWGIMDLLKQPSPPSGILLEGARSFWNIRIEAGIHSILQDSVLRVQSKLLG